MALADQLDSDFKGDHPNVVMFSGVRGAQHTIDGIVNSSSTTLRSDTANFSVSDIGASLTVMPQPGTSSNPSQIFTISAIIDSQHVTLSTTSAYSLTNAFIFWGFDTASQIQTTVNTYYAYAITPSNNVAYNTPWQIEITGGRYRCNSGLLIDVGYTRLSGLNAILDFSGIPTRSISSIANPNSGNVTINLTAHGFQVNQCVSLNGITGQTLLNNYWIIKTVVDTNHFIIFGAIGNGVSSSGGTATIAAISVTGTQIFGDANNSPNIPQCFRGLQIIGQGHNNLGPGICLSNPNIPAGITNPGPAYASFEDCVVRSFSVGLIFGSNSYINSFLRCSFNDNFLGITTLQNAVNLAERTVFSICAFSGNTNDFILTYQFCDFYFQSCSFDFMTNSVIQNIGGGWIFLSQCHIEQDSDNANWFYVSGGDSMISFTDCEFVITGSVFIQSFSTFYSATGQSRGGIRLFQCQFFYFVNSFGRQFLVDGPGTAVATNIVQWSANRATISNQLNVLADGGFESSGNLSRYWNLSGTNLPVYSSSSPHSGSQCLLLSTPGGGSSIIQQWFPICPGDDIYVTFWRKTSDLATSGGVLRIEFDYYDLAGTLIEFNRNDYTTNATSWKLSEVDPTAGPSYGQVGVFTVCAPPGTVRMGIQIMVTGTTANCSVFIDDLCVNICGKSITAGAVTRLAYGEYVEVNGQFPTNKLIGVDFLTGTQDRVQLFVPGSTSTNKALIALLGNTRATGIGDGNITPVGTLDVHDTVGNNTTLIVTEGASQGSAPFQVKDKFGNILFVVNSGGSLQFAIGGTSQGIFFSTGSPNGTVTASPGSLNLDSSGTLWVKATGTGNTGWLAVITGTSSVTSINGLTGVLTTTITNPSGGYQLSLSSVGTVLAFTLSAPGAWSPFVPTVTGLNFVTVTMRGELIGKTATVRFKLVGTAIAATIPTITLPYATLDANEWCSTTVLLTGSFNGTAYWVPSGSTLTLYAAPSVAGSVYTYNGVYVYETS